MPSNTERLLGMRGNLCSAGNKHRDGECKKCSLCQGPACEELYNLIHWVFATRVE